MDESRRGEWEGGDLLEGRLLRAARYMTYPTTPDLARGARARLGQGRAMRRPVRIGSKGKARWAVVALVAFLLLLASLLVPEVRAFIRNLFRIGSVEVVVATPTPLPPNVTPQPSATPAWSLNLAGETTFEEARSTLSFPLRTPMYTAGLGSPDRVFVQDLGGSAAVLAWTPPERADTAELVLFAFSSRMMARKFLEESEMLQETSVGTNQALWIRGPHVIEFSYGSGPTREYTNLEARRLVGGNTLLWSDGGLTYRLETTLPLEEAVRIAESLK